MSEQATRRAVYEDLFDIPENMTGEIIGGRLIATPRPSRKHSLAAIVVGSRLTPPYYLGEGGGPGGWIILVEPEVDFDGDILVPDLAGWKRERFPIEEPHNWISVAPDWVCEILSPSTAQTDRTEKMPIYSRHHVSYAWLIDPTLRTLEVYRFEPGIWIGIGAYAKSARVRAEPFPELELDLSLLWLE
jgi:Uma2 family endonuclease